MKTILMVLAPQDFRDSEYIVPRAFWEQLGFRVQTTSLVQIAVGRFGFRVTNDVLLADAEEQDFDGIFFVGGTGSLVYQENKTAKALTSSFIAAGKPYGAICAAPRNFAAWGLLTGKKCTGHNSDGSFAALCAQVGAEFVDAPTVTDGLLCTGAGPTATEATALQFAELFA